MAGIALLGLLAVGCSKHSSKEPTPPATPSLHALNTSPRIGDFAVYAANSAKVLDRVVLSGGDLGVRNTGSGTFLVSGFRLALINSARVETTRSSLADSVQLVNGASVGDVQTNRLVNNGGSYLRKFAFPVMPAMPTLAAVSPGTSNLTVSSGQTRVVSPGRFATVTVGGILRLSGGGAGYDFASLQVNNDARVEVLGPVQIRIAGRLTILDRGLIIAASGTTLRAGDIRMEVRGQNGASGGLGDWPKAVSIGNDCELRALLLAPNGTIQIGQRDSIAGALVGRDVSIDIDTRINFESGFPAPPCVPVDCNDVNPCTADVCSNGTCTHTPVLTSTNCSDGNACNGLETCNASGVCMAGAAPTLDDGNPCTSDTCDPATGVKHAPLPEGTACTDANACNGAETCNATGSCIPGTAPTLDDGNPCTTDTCDPAAGVKHTPVFVGTSCSDGNACNGEEKCDDAGACGPGELPAVDDGNPCTADSCDPAMGAQHVPVAAGTSCSDGNACNGVEACDGNGTCLPGSPPPVDDGKPCTIDTCDPVLGVQHVPVVVSTVCSDGNACNGMESCDVNGVCLPGTPPALDDEKVCTTDTCDPATGPVHAPVPAGTGCSDGNACNGAEACDDAGNCQPGTPITCSATDQCHEVGQCDPPSGQCSNPAKTDGVSCDDGNKCTVDDTCQAGTCVPGSPKQCQPPDSCHDAGACDPATGECPAGLDGGCGESEGMLVGTVLDDSTGMPLAGATIRLGDQSVLSRDDGRYTLPAGKADEVVLAIEREGYTVCQRVLPVAAGVGSVPLGARLTPLAAAATVTEIGATLEAKLPRGPGASAQGTLRIPAGTFAGSVALRFTPLSAQGLPGRLPLGWSPLVAFDLQTGSAAPSSPLGLAVQGLPEGSAQQVQYDPAAHGWRRLGDVEIASDGAANLSLAGQGAFALVVPDAPGAAATPATGALLTGLGESAGFVAQATANGVPSVLPASGGLVEGRITLPASTSPSGLALQVAVSEAFNLTTGGTASVARRVEDIVLFRTTVPLGGLDAGVVEEPQVDGGAPALPLGAGFAIKPSRSYSIAEISQGNIHVDILASRPATRGKLGGLRAVTVENSGASLTVPAGALAVQTVVDIESAEVPTWVPRSTGLVPLAGLMIDLAGATLTAPAQLQITGLSVAATDTLLLARMHRLPSDGVARPVLVARGSVSDGVCSFVTGDLPGITKEGEYIVYRTTQALGTLSGTASAPAGSGPIMITTDGLPFVALTGPGGAYTLPAVPGTVAVSASIPNSNLNGSISVQVAAGSASPGNLSLTPLPTQATVTPKNGAINVERTVQIELSASAGLDPTTLTLENIRLYRQPVSQDNQILVRLVPGGAGRFVAIIPQTRLAAGTGYSLEVTGLKDVYGAPIAVGAVSFTTKTEAPPTFDTDRIEFTMPDSNGMVTLTVPAGALPAGTTIIITNEGNGMVTGHTVNNDGSMTDVLPASIDDRLSVSVTGPLGDTKTFVRSRYKGPDGKVAVGSGGGVVEGPGGVALRIPEGALKYGTVFSIEPVDIATIADRPPLDDASFPSAISVNVQGNPFFRKEIDLVFPKPADAPDGAFYYVFQRHEPVAGEVLAGGAAYKVIDHAFVEGQGAAARVVTASCPFPGFMDAYAGAIGSIFDLASSVSGPAIASAQGPRNLLSNLGVTTLVGVLGVSTPADLMNRSLFVLAYTYSEIAKGFPTVGLVRGRVVQPVLTSNQNGEPTYFPVGAAVTGTDAGGHSFLSSTVSNRRIYAETQDDGTYTLWDPFPTPENVTIAALKGQDPATAAHGPAPVCPPTRDDVACVKAYQSVVETCAQNTTYYRNQLKANITFPPVAPTTSGPPPAVQIQVMRVAEDGTRQSTKGVAVVGQPLLIGFTSSTAEVRSVALEHGGVGETVGGLRRDPLVGQPTGMDQIADYTPQGAGTYTMTATALPFAGGNAFTVSSTFRVVAAGGTITSPVPGDPPAVLSALTVPLPDSSGVPTSVTLQVVFSEPVLGVFDQVDLLDLGPAGSVGTYPVTLPSISLTGVNVNGQPVSVDDPANRSVPITSLTIQPTRQLKYNEVYKLVLKSGIFDLDNTLPGGPGAGRTLAPQYETQFTTVEAKALPLASPGTFSSGGIATVGDYAYVIEHATDQGHHGILRVFDISNPADPVEHPEAQMRALGKPMGLVAQPDGEGAKVVIVTGPGGASMPSNLRVYRVTPTTTTNAQGQRVTTVQSKWIAAASLSATAQEGIVQRVAVKGNLAYTVSTQNAAQSLVQVVDLQFAETLFVDRGGDSSRVRIPLNTDGMGFGQEAVVAKIAVPKGNSGMPAFLADLKVADLNQDGHLQPVVVAAGNSGIVLVNPQTAEVLPERPLESLGFKARGVDVGKVNGRDIAVVVGETSGAQAVAVVDISDPTKPELLGSPLLVLTFGRLIDVKLKGELALLGGDKDEGTIRIVNVAEAVQSKGMRGQVFEAGKIDQIGGRLVIAENGAIVCAMPSTSGGDVELGGLRIAAAGISVFLSVRAILSVSGSNALSAWADGWDKTAIDAVLTTTEGRPPVGRKIAIVHDPDVQVEFGGVTCGTACVLVDDQGQMRLYAKSRRVGSYLITLTDEYGNERTLRLQFGPRKVVILVPGIMTSLCCDPAGQCRECSPPENGGFQNITEELTARGFDNDQVLWYSYRSGMVEPTTGRWKANGYDEGFTAQSHSASINWLFRLVNEFGQIHPNTEFWAVGHSQGGLLALQLLGNIPSMPANTRLAGILTLDGALGGAPWSETMAANLFTGWNGPAVADMIELYESASEHERQGTTARMQCSRSTIQLCACPAMGCTNRDFVEANLQTVVRTIGNSNDCVFRPGRCMLVPVVDNSSTQVVEPNALVEMSGTPWPSISKSHSHVYAFSSGEVGRVIGGQVR